MDRILTRPKLNFEYKDGKDKYYSLKKPLMYEYEGKTYVINPQDETGTFMFNLASVPWYLRWLHRVNSKQTLYPSIVHDHDYSNFLSNRKIDDLKFKSLTKFEQIELLKKEKGFNKLKSRLRYFFTRWSLYLILRAFGWLNKAKH